MYQILLLEISDVEWDFSELDEVEDIDEAFHENWDDKLAELDEKEDGDL
jgi:hypothetical protein